MTESDEMRAARARTMPGQADWGIGPETCRECEFWSGGKNRYSIGTLKPAPCSKAQRMMATQAPNIPYYALSCRFFQRAASPPEVIIETKRK